MSFIQDYLDGTYPDFRLDLFVSDLAFSIITAIRDKDVVKIRFTPLLFESELFGPLDRVLCHQITRNIKFEKDDSVSPDDLWAYDIALGEPDLEYEKFLEYISYDKSIECSPEDFRLLRLFNLYSKFVSR